MKENDFVKVLTDGCICAVKKEHIISIKAINSKSQLNQLELILISGDRIIAERRKLDEFIQELIKS